MLYTAYGPECAHRRTFVLDRASWEAIHGQTALTRIPAFMPFRAPVSWLLVFCSFYRSVSGHATCL